MDCWAKVFELSVIFRLVFQLHNLWSMVYWVLRNEFSTILLYVQTISTTYISKVEYFPCWFLKVLQSQDSFSFLNGFDCILERKPTVILSLHWQEHNYTEFLESSEWFIHWSECHWPWVTNRDKALGRHVEMHYEGSVWGAQRWLHKSLVNSSSRLKSRAQYTAKRNQSHPRTLCYQSTTVPHVMMTQDLIIALWKYSLVLVMIV